MPTDKHLETPDASAHSRRGAMVILSATAIAGGSGYIATAVVGAVSTPADYAVFGVFWSALYLVIAALSGVQQEVTRAARRQPGAGPLTGMRPFTAGAAGLACLIVAASSPLWLGAIDGTANPVWLFPILVGICGYLVVTVVVGVLYGLELWVPIAAFSIVDGVLRLALILLVVALGGDQLALAWAVVLPFPLTPLLLWLLIRRRVVGQVVLDVSIAALTRNSARSVGATIATGVMISGFPLVLALIATSEPAAQVGAIVLAINVVRAPLVIVVLSMQSFFVVRFRNLGDASLALFAKGTVVIAAATVVFALAAAVLGPVVVETIWPQYDVSSLVLVGLVVASGVLGVLCLSGPLTLAAGLHSWYFAGWALSAVATVVFLLLPLDLDARVVVALTAGPVVGIVMHVVAAFADRRRTRRVELTAR